MNLKRSPTSLQDKNQKDLDNAIDNSTFNDLIRNQNDSINDTNSVHHRRDLDSLG
tara:strand:- start:491 stop:655 length:165 start_codon:yes stop_codon:yes gene_type:complete